MMTNARTFTMRSKSIAGALALTSALAFALAVTGSSGGSAAAATSSQAQTLSAAKKKPARRAHRPSRQIACTVFGCQRVPPGCYPRTGFDFWGNPTGFDVIVCPRG